MAANLDRKENGEASVVLVGKPAWHKEGTLFDTPPTFAEGIIASGTDYVVEKQPVFHLNSETGEYEPIAKKFATVRTDRQEVLGVVGNTYRVLQNMDAWGFFEKAIERGDVTLESAGALDGGKTAWILCKLPEVIRIHGDVQEPYILLSNSFDGSSPVRAGFNSVRVVCQNTHTMAMGSFKNEVRIRHCTNMDQRLHEAERVLIQSKAFFEKYAEAANHLADIRMTDSQVKAFVHELYPDPDANDKGLVVQRAANIRTDLTRIYNNGLGQEGIRGTRWGALNAVSRYADHEMTVRSTTSRLKSVWMGSASELKQTAFNLLLDTPEQSDFVLSPKTALALNGV
jgi:phage/plasmid-like protein (TIGR03299 family)